MYQDNIKFLFSLFKRAQNTKFEKLPVYTVSYRTQNGQAFPKNSRFKFTSNNTLLWAIKTGVV